MSETTTASETLVRKVNEIARGVYLGHAATDTEREALRLAQEAAGPEAVAACGQVFKTKASRQSHESRCDLCLPVRKAQREQVRAERQAAKANEPKAERKPRESKDERPKADLFVPVRFKIENRNGWTVFGYDADGNERQFASASSRDNARAEMAALKASALKGGE